MRDKLASKGFQSNVITWKNTRVTFAECVGKFAVFFFSPSRHFARIAVVRLRSAGPLQLQGLERILSDSKQMNEQSPGEARGAGG